MWWHQTKLHVRRHIWFPADTPRKALLSELKFALTPPPVLGITIEFEIDENRVERKGVDPATANITHLDDRIRVSISADGSSDHELDAGKVAWAEARSVAKILEKGDSRFTQLKRLGFSQTPEGEALEQESMGKHASRVFMLAMLGSFLTMCSP